MYLKVEKGSELYTKFFEFQTRIDNARKQLKDLVLVPYGAENGASSRDAEFLFGPMIGVVFKEGELIDTTLWKQIKHRGNWYWYPKKKNKELLEKLKSVPTIKQKELCDIIKYEYLQEFEVDGQLKISFSFGYTYVRDKDVFLLDLRREAKFERSPDLIEITESEFYSYFPKES